MSSILGHAIAGAGIGRLFRLPERDSCADLLWSLWLVGVAVAPDLDYVVPWLSRAAHDGLRITHSLPVCCLLPLLTVLALAFIHLPSQERRIRGVQVLVAGLSHLLMDLFVGVTALPLLWPFSTVAYRLPFGLLPSAPAYRLDNPYLYRNTLLELAIIVPFFWGIALLRSPTPSGRSWWLLAVLGAVFVVALAWGYSLAR